MRDNLGEIYELGRKAANGNKYAMIKLIQKKQYLISKFSYGDEDCNQYIIEVLIRRIKNYKFF